MGCDPSGRAFADLFSPADADRLLTTGGLRHPHLRLVRDGSSVPRQEFTTRRRVGGRSVDDLVDPALALDAFRRGATLVFQSMHTFWPPLAALCGDLSAELGHPVQANAYLSPRSARGLALHYDTHDVFALQVAGAKRWEVFPPAFADPLATQPWSAPAPDTGGDGPSAPEALGPPQVESTLCPGDSLFVPRGHLHRAWTTSEHSLHITIGVRSRTWHGVFEALVARAADDPRFRAAVPAAPGAADVDHFRRLVHQWVDTQDLAELAAFDPAPHQRALAGHHRGMLAAAMATLNDATVLTHRHPRAALRLVEAGDHVVLHAPDRTVRFPARVAPALARLLDADHLTVEALSSHLDHDGRLVLARRLVAEGLLRPEPAPGPEGEAGR